jgi:tRNA-Thr(GGU) m(6)t(6)A37 methyltransferase TsaA
MKEIQLRPIGIIHSPFTGAGGTPIQSAAGRDVRATVEVYPEYSEGLQDLEGFSHLFLLYYCHRVGKFSLKVYPFMDTVLRGVFATRAPSRPNSIGLSVVRLVSRDENILTIQEVDILDGTPLLDIKPYIEDFDVRRNTRKGWLENKVVGLHRTRDDSRFVREDGRTEDGGRVRKQGRPQDGGRGSGRMEGRRRTEGQRKRE